MTSNICGICDKIEEGTFVQVPKEHFKDKLFGADVFLGYRCIMIIAQHKVKLNKLEKRTPD